MGFDKFRRKIVAPKGALKETVNCIKGTLTAVATPYAAANPIGADVIVTEVILDITTNPTSTPVTADIGCAAATIGVSNDNLIDGAQIGGTDIGAKVFNSIDDKGTNGALARKWTSSTFLTMCLTGTPTGLVGSIYIYYRKA